MEIILLERVEKLGQMGDVVRVKDGYARNYLLPRNLGMLANAANVRQLEHEPADDVVDARAQASAGHDAAAELRRVEEDAIARPRQLEGRETEPPASGGAGGLAEQRARAKGRQTVVEQDLVRFADEVDGAAAEAGRHRRGKLAGPENLDRDVRLGEIGVLGERRAVTNGSRGHDETRIRPGGQGGR